MKKIIIKADYRYKIGTNNSNKIRKKNYIPAIIYNKNKKNIKIKIKYNLIWNIIKNKKNIKNIKIKIKIKKKKIKCKIKEIQKHPFKNKILHIDFIK